MLTNVLEVNNILMELDKNSILPQPNVETETKLLSNLARIRQDLVQELAQFRRPMEERGPVYAGLIGNVEDVLQRVDSRLG